MLEKEFVAEIYRICNVFGILVHHCENSVHCSGTRGMPDLILVGSHGILFAELKRDSHDVRSSHQTTWHWVLQSAGVRSLLWTPADLPAIREILASLAGLDEK